MYLVWERKTAAGLVMVLVELLQSYIDISPKPYSSKADVKGANMHYITFIFLQDLWLLQKQDHNKNERTVNNATALFTHG